MSRNTHYMRVAVGGAIPPSVLSVSCRSGSPDEFAWCWLHWTPEGNDDTPGGSGWGNDSRSFWLALRGHLTHHRNTWVVLMGAAHQLAQLGFWELLEGDEWQLEGDDERSPKACIDPRGRRWNGYAVIEDPPTIILARPRRCQGAVKFLDVRNYGVSGWNALGIDPHDKSKGVWHCWDRPAAIRRFMAAWIDTVREHRLGSVQTTAASQAMHAFRHRFLKSPVKVHADLPVLGLERQSLYAGRNECWRMGKVNGPVYHLDVNACYPAAAAHEPMPARLAGFSLGCKVMPDKLAMQGYCCIAEVTLEASKPDWPVRFSWERHGADYLRGLGGAPRLRPRTGDMIYPVGRFATVLCGPELQHAFEEDAVKRVWSVAWYEPADLFTQWCTELHELGEVAHAAGRHAVEECVKRVRNSLFGKFAQWAWRWQPCPEVAPIAPFALWYAPPLLKPGEEIVRQVGGQAPWGASRTGFQPLVRYRSIGWLCQVEEGMGEHAESCPAISAWVYSLARMRLRGAIETAGRDNVYYMDADSLFMNHTGYRRMEKAGVLDERRMGAWKLKGAYDWVRFYGLKMYETPGMSVHCGAPADAPGTFRSGWKFWAPEKLMPALEHGRPPGVEMLPLSLKASENYRHGRVCINGKVVPFCFSEE